MYEPTTLQARIATFHRQRYTLRTHEGLLRMFDRKAMEVTDSVSREGIKKGLAGFVMIAMAYGAEHGFDLLTEVEARLSELKKLGGLHPPEFRIEGARTEDLINEEHAADCDCESCRKAWGRKTR